MLLLIVHFNMGRGLERVQTRWKGNMWEKQEKVLVSWKPFPFTCLLLMGMEKEGRIIIVEVSKGVGDSPCLWSVPRKQDNAPCPGLIGSRSAPS